MLNKRLLSKIFTLVSVEFPQKHIEDNLISYYHSFSEFNILVYWENSRAIHLTSEE